MKKILIFIFFYNFSLAWAVDTYNATNNQLSIPKVNVGINTYTDVVITVGSIVSINGADTGTNDDTYNTANNQLSIPLVSADGVVYKNAVITVEKVIAIGNKLPTITWVQTSNSIPTTFESIGLYRSRNGFGAFDFFGKGYKSFFFTSGGEFNTPRSASDAGFLFYSINNKNEIFAETSPLSSNYIAGFVTNYLQGNFGSNSDSLIFIDQGRESLTLPTSQWDHSYLWRLDKVGQSWQVKEFAQELGKQFWHSSNNPIDINGDGVLDFTVSNLIDFNKCQILFVSNKLTGVHDIINLTSSLYKDNVAGQFTIPTSGSSALIKIAGGKYGVVSLPYSVNLPYASATMGTVATLTSDGKSVTSTQFIPVRGTQLTSDLTSTEGYNSIHVLDINGDGLDDFIGIAESSLGGLDNLKRVIVFTQNKDGTFKNANVDLVLPFTYSLPNNSNKPFSDTVSNEFLVIDIDGDGIQDLFFNTQMISQQSVDSYGIRGGLKNANGKFSQYSIPNAKIKFNNEKKPSSGYHYILPTEINGDGIIDFVLVGEDYDKSYISGSNIYGQFFKVSFLLSQKN